MVLAADYPFLDVFWTMILFFFWVAWISILVTIVIDLFRRHDASGWVKALWLVVLIFVPFLGVLAYLIVNGDGMGKRNVERAQSAAERYAPASNGGAAGEIAKAKSLLDSGALTQAEFDQLKAKALA
ncbi:PLDc N-terminal domain-containing protein [Solirubrobacter ginsenosidimutans]|uniref:PLDc N-terminal domain-containing protein n=1 Tax=Solirubrobacter ginsenosidimutans TaxID=490573 RepID=A0A9X3MPP2_9ACTN|nr:PLDc N-terminal domain-containing protein [Solirubrobacter ginsenosidimutans]MDA0158973.1 PLDc N-terminal domain-containing protein [Solirubrobacter ginsenosidimutans]